MAVPKKAEQKPSTDLVEAVMQECGCTAETAIYLLDRAKNDVAKAKRHHHLYQRYVDSPVSSTPPTPSPESIHSEADQNVDWERSSKTSAIPNDFREGGDCASENKARSPPLFTHDGISNAAHGVGNASRRNSGMSNTTSPAISSDGIPRLPLRDLLDPQPVSNAQRPPLCKFEASNPALGGLTEWDFKLPKLPSPGNLDQLYTGESDTFSPNKIAAAAQHGIPVRDVRNYLDSYDFKTVKEYIGEEVEGIAPIFYAVFSHRDEILRLFLDYGASPSALHGSSGVPLLAFTIVHGEISKRDTSKMVSILLSYGASPKVIPKWLYSPYDRDQPENTPKELSEEANSKLVEWCTGFAKEKISKANITQRYFLDRATKVKAPSVKRRQVARLRKCERLLGIPYFIIGQRIATDLLIHRLLAYLLLPSKQPLVLCFAGPSGHGKTELARQLGIILSLDLEVVDCTVMNREMELFGPRAPYIGSENGSPLNNFLAAHSGKRCLVFLDEFEKTTKEIHQSLLIPFDNGEYRDRRNNNSIDCSNTIWIMATNALDDTILDFCLKNEAIFGEDQSEQSRLALKLSGQLREAFLQFFDAPVTGRVSEFVPFLPFTTGEQAVVTHKCLLELTDRLRRPINLSKGPEEQLVGNIRLSIRKDASVCLHLAEENYHQKLGARSLKAGAKKVEQIILDTYLDEDEEIEESEEMRDFTVDFHAGQIVATAGRRRAVV